MPILEVGFQRSERDPGATRSHYPELPTGCNAGGVVVGTLAATANLGSSRSCKTRGQQVQS